MKLSNGSLTGALGNLQRRVSDVALTAFFMKVVKTFSGDKAGGFKLFSVDIENVSWL